MPTFKLDGREIPFEPGDTIIRAAHRAGIDIPHYCWHPGLSVAGQLPHVPGRDPAAAGPRADDARRPRAGTRRRATTSPRRSRSSARLPAWPRAEGMEVLSDIERARDAGARGRAGVPAAQPPGRLPDLRPGRRVPAAGLLARAPGARSKRMRDETVHKPKAVVFGPTIVYDAERCIVCTRCVRFCDEVAQGPGARRARARQPDEIVRRPGPPARPRLHADDRARLPGRRAHRRGLPLQGARLVPAQRAHACARAAPPAATRTSTSIRATSTAYRHRPRDNEAVNQYWMCDEGMLDVPARPRGPRARRRASRGKDATLDDGARQGRERAQGRRPGRARRRALGAALERGQLRAPARSRGLLGTGTSSSPGKRAGRGRRHPASRGQEPELRGRDRAVHQHAAQPFAELVEAHRGRARHSRARARLERRPTRAPRPPSPSSRVWWCSPPTTGRWRPRGTVVLPASSWAECDGTFVNAKGMAQESEKAIAPQGDAASRRGSSSRCSGAPSASRIGLEQARASAEGRWSPKRARRSLPRAPARGRASGERRSDGAGERE